VKRKWIQTIVFWVYVGTDDSSRLPCYGPRTLPNPKTLCIHGPSVSYNISTGTLAIETAAFLTLCLLLSATFHVSLCFPRSVKLNFFCFPPILTMTQLRHQGIGMNATGNNAQLRITTVTRFSWYTAAKTTFCSFVV